MSADTQIMLSSRNADDRVYGKRVHYPVAAAGRTLRPAQPFPSLPPTRRVIEALPAGTAYEARTMVAETDIVMVYGRYSGRQPLPLIAVEVFRFEGGTVVECWTVPQREVPALEMKAGYTVF